MLNWLQFDAFAEAEFLAEAALTLAILLIHRFLTLYNFEMNLYIQIISVRK
jgi:hypothetical protein